MNLQRTVQKPSAPVGFSAGAGGNGGVKEVLWHRGPAHSDCELATVRLCCVASVMMDVRFLTGIPLSNNPKSNC